MNRLSHERSHTFSFSSFMSDLSIVGSANVGVFILGTMQGLILPKILTVEDYGYWKLFLLYTGFSGLLHFGFADGIYLNWAGKQIKGITDVIRQAFWVLFAHLIMMGFLLLIIFLNCEFESKNILILAVIYAVIMNLMTFSQFTFQAVRRFKIVSILNIIRPSIFLGCVGTLYFLKILDYEKVILSYIGACLIVFTSYLYFLKEEIQLPWRKKINYFSVLSKYITSGWPLLFGNFIVFLILNTDVIIVRALFSIKNFAFYTFAITVLGIFSVFTNTISTVIFPHLAIASTQIRNKAFSLSASVIVLIWGIILGIYPLAAIFISYFLPNYSETLPYIRILMLSVAFITTIQILHSNYYKLYFQQTQYFLSALFISLISFAATFAATRYTYDLKVIAFVKVGVLLMWFIINELLLMNYIKQSLISLVKRLSIIFCFSAVFWISWYLELPVLQMVFYLVIAILIVAIFFKDEIRNLKKLRYVQ